MISRFFWETHGSRFCVMLVLLFCKLSEQYRQTNFPIIKPFKVTKKEWQIFRPKWAKIKSNYFIFLIKKKNKYTH